MNPCLPRQPLRFVLAGDPPAGKTILTGLLIRELWVRAGGRRVLIIYESVTDHFRNEMNRTDRLDGKRKGAQSGGHLSTPEASAQTA